MAFLDSGGALLDESPVGAVNGARISTFSHRFLARVVDAPVLRLAIARLRLDGDAIRVSNLGPLLDDADRGELSATARIAAPIFTE